MRQFIDSLSVIWKAIRESGRRNKAYEAHLEWMKSEKAQSVERQQGEMSHHAMVETFRHQNKKRTGS